MLVDLDETRLAPGRTPLSHSPAAAVLWGLFVCMSVYALSPKNLAGAALALSVGFGSHLAIDAFTEGGIFLWPRTRSPSDWLRPYRPESLVQLDGQLFLVPSPDGTVPRPWNGWRWISFMPVWSVRGSPGRAVERLCPYAGQLLSAAGLAALLAAVILA